MKLYTFENDEINGREITQAEFDKFRKKVYQVVQWDRSWFLFKWNGDKYVIEDKSNKRESFKEFELESQYV